MNFITSKDKLSNTRKKLLISFQKSLGIHFKDISLLDLAFHHRSFSNETSKKDLSHSQNIWHISVQNILLAEWKTL